MSGFPNRSLCQIHLPIYLLQSVDFTDLQKKKKKKRWNGGYYSLKKGGSGRQVVSAPVMAPVREHSAQHLFPIVSKASCSRWTVTPHMGVTFHSYSLVVRFSGYMTSGGPRVLCRACFWQLPLCTTLLRWSIQASAIREPRTFRCSSWFQKRQRNQRSNCQYLLDHRKSKRVPEKTSIFAFLTTRKPSTVWITINWKILKEMGIPDHLTCLLRNLYAGQEATVRTGHGTTDWFQIGKGVHQGCILSSCLFNLYAEYIMKNAGLVEAQAGIKISGRNISNLRQADDTTLMAKSKKELKSL